VSLFDSVAIEAGHSATVNPSTLFGTPGAALTSPPHGRNACRPAAPGACPHHVCAAGRLASAPHHVWAAGPDPAGLAAFYSDDAFYADPAIPAGGHGRQALTGYFTRLLGRFPRWVWTQTRATPLERGFLNHWRAEIPVAGRQIVATGVCTVQMRDGLIERNEVFFDRSELLAELDQAKPA
jgi:hypothetical protein